MMRVFRGRVYCGLLMFVLIILSAAGCIPPRYGAQDPPDCVDVWNFAVGYGDATLLNHNDSWVLVDGGYSVMTGYLLEQLMRLGVPELDMVVLTHPHPDHIGGVHGILQSGFPVSALCGAYSLEAPETPAGFRDLVRERRIPYRQIRDGDRIRLGSALLTVLHPRTPGPNMNDSSTVLKLDGYGGGFLLPADIGPEAQAELLREHGGDLSAAVMKAPHHGGESLEDFFNAVSPRIMIVSVGVNPYGNPHKKTMEWRENRDCAVYRTDRTGTVVLRLHAGTRYEISFPDVPRGTFLREYSRSF